MQNLLRICATAREVGAEKCAADLAAVMPDLLKARAAAMADLTAELNKVSKGMTLTDHGDDVAYDNLVCYRFYAMVDVESAHPSRSMTKCKAAYDVADALSTGTESWGARHG
jgi:hypothetical protein